MKTWIAGLALWLLIGGLAAATVLWRLAHPPRLPALAAAGSMPQLPLPPSPPPFQLPPQEHYSDIVAYPVFIATRLPEPPSEDASSVEKPPSGPEPTPVLLGVMIMPQVTVALLRPVQPGAKTMRSSWRNGGRMEAGRGFPSSGGVEQGTSEAGTGADPAKTTRRIASRETDGEQAASGCDPD